MSQLVPSNLIEDIVGVNRHPTDHYGRIVNGTWYIMHSQACVDTGRDLRQCDYSLAMGNGTLTMKNGEPQVLTLREQGLAF